MGDHTTCPMPSSLQAGTTRSSMTRHRAEYWGWLDTRRNPIWLAISWPERIWSAVHSETPMYSALPLRSTSAKAAMVSSSGVS